jgi:hypothetical protein
MYRPPSGGYAIDSTVSSCVSEDWVRQNPPREPAGGVGACRRLGKSRCTPRGQSAGRPVRRYRPEDFPFQGCELAHFNDYQLLRIDEMPALRPFERTLFWHSIFSERRVLPALRDSSRETLLLAHGRSTNLPPLETRPGSQPVFSPKKF